MAAEADQEIEQEEVAETFDSSLAEFQEMLDAAPEIDEEQELDDTSAEGESPEGEQSVDGEEAATTPAKPPVSEGPSFLMKREAASAGVRQELIDRAKSDEQLELLIEAATSRQEPEGDAPKEAFSFKLELPEDEFGPDDPVRKALQSLVDQQNAREAEREKAFGMLFSFANQQLERETTRDAEVAQAQYQSLYAPFDEELDSFASDVLGKHGTLNDAQKQERQAIAASYQAFGVTPDTPVAEKKRLAILALQARHPDLVAKRPPKQQAAPSQQRRVLGGGSQRPVQRAQTEADLLKEWDDVLVGRKPLSL